MYCFPIVPIRSVFTGGNPFLAIGGWYLSWYRVWRKRESELYLILVGTIEACGNCLNNFSGPSHNGLKVQKFSHTFLFFCDLCSCVRSFIALQCKTFISAYP